jgi:DDE domain
VRRRARAGSIAAAAVTATPAAAAAAVRISGTGSRPANSAAAIRPRAAPASEPARPVIAPSVMISRLSAEDELIPSTLHTVERYANNPVEADHGRLKARLRLMRGLKRHQFARILAAGHAFMQNLRRSHYELATDVPARHRVHVAFDQLVMAIRSAGHPGQRALSCAPIGQCNTAS